MATPIVIEEAATPAARTRRHSRFTDYVGVAAGTAPIVLLLLASFFLPLPYSPTQPDPAAVTLPPGPQHWFGTDGSGFDVLSRTIASAQVDLPVAFGGALLSLIIGVPLGLLASSDRWFAHLIMRATDVLQSLPLLIVTVAVVSLAGNSIGNVIFGIVLVGAPGFIRLVRSGAIVVRSSRYVDAAIAMGCSPLRVLRVHVFPNIFSIALVQFTLATSTAIIVIAGLNFLGIGTAAPTPSWGVMIRSGADVIGQGYWWVATFPSLAVVLVVVSLNFVSRSLDDLVAGR